MYNMGCINWVTLIDYQYAHVNKFLYESTIRWKHMEISQRIQCESRIYQHILCVVPELILTRQHNLCESKQHNQCNWNMIFQTSVVQVFWPIHIGHVNMICLKSFHHTHQDILWTKHCMPMWSIEVNQHM